MLLVYSTDEQPLIDASGATPRLERDLSLVVEGRAVATAGDTLEALLDTIAMEVEQVIFLDASVGGLARSIDLVRSTHLVADDPAERLTGAVRLEFLITYRTPEGDPQTAV